MCNVKHLADAAAAFDAQRVACDTQLEEGKAQLSLRAPRAVVVTRPPPRLVRSDVLRLRSDTHLSALSHTYPYARYTVRRAVSLEN